MKQIVADAAHLAAPLDGVVALRLGPGIRQQDVRLRPDPWQTGREADERIPEIVECDLRRTAGPVAYIDARNTELLGGLLSVTDLLGVIPVPVHTRPNLGNQCWGEDVVVVDRAAVRALDTGSLEPGTANAARSTVDPIDGRVEGHRAREAVAHRESVAIGLVVVHLHVELVRVSVEGAIDEKVLSERV